MYGNVFVGISQSVMDHTLHQPPRSYFCTNELMGKGSLVENVAPTRLEMPPKNLPGWLTLDRYTSAGAPDAFASKTVGFLVHGRNRGFPSHIHRMCQ